MMRVRGASTDNLYSNVVKQPQVREIREAQAGVLGGESMEVLIGGTTFLTPADMHELLLGTKSTP